MNKRELADIRETGGQWLYEYLGIGGESWIELPYDEAEHYCKAFDHFLSTVQTDTLRLAVVRERGELPENPFCFGDSMETQLRRTYAKAQQAMLNAGWIQEVK